MAYDINKIRQQIKKRIKRDSDPTEFKPAKAEGDQVLKYRFIVLPPFEAGDMIEGNRQAPQTMETFFVTDGAHYINNGKIGCPRSILDEDCCLCNYGFDMLNAIPKEDKDKRADIRKKLLSSQYYKVNIFFPPLAENPTPQQLVGKVFWFNAPKTVFDIWWEAFLRDGPGNDEEDPQPYGVIYDERSAYIFELCVKYKGLGNNYETSKFLRRRVPLVINKDKKPDEERIKKILAQRHNLFDKVAEIDNTKLQSIVADLSGNPVVDDGFDSDETKSKPPKSNPKPSKTTEQKPKKSADPEPVIEEPVVEEPVVEEQSTDNTADLSGELPVDESSNSAGPSADGSTDSGDSGDSDKSDGSDADVDALLSQLLED